MNKIQGLLATIIFSMFLGNSALADNFPFYCRSRDINGADLDGAFSIDRSSDNGSVWLKLHLPGELTLVWQTGDGQFTPNGAISYSSSGEGKNFNKPIEGLFLDYAGWPDTPSKLVVGSADNQVTYTMSCSFGEAPVPLCSGMCGWVH